MRQFLGIFSESLDNLTKSSLKKTQTTIFGIIFILLCLVVDNSNL